MFQSCSVACLSPRNRRKTSSYRPSGPRPVATGRHSGAVPPKFSSAQKNVYKNKNLAHIKCISPQTLKPGYGPVRPQQEVLRGPIKSDKPPTIGPKPTVCRPLAWCVYPTCVLLKPLTRYTICNKHRSVFSREL